MKHPGRIAGALLVMLLLAAGSAMAATSTKGAKPASSNTSARLDTQKRLIDAQQAEIDTLEALIAQQKALLGAQRVMVDSQAVKVVAQQARLDTLEQQLAETRQRLDELSSQAGLPALQKSLEERLKAVETATKKAPELPPDVVSAGDFPGSIRIPGTDAAIKFGAKIRTAAVFTLDPLGTDDRFLTNSIPVGDTVTSGEAKRMNISARASRLNIEFRTPGGREQVRAFFEGDFAGAGNAFRLRHAYAQYVGFIVGQTWSTFSDPAANHQDLDFEGVSSENLIRQPQIRYWWGTEGGERNAVAIETPAVSITGAQGVNLFPDVVARTYFPLPKDGHLQVAGVLRQIRGQATSGEVRTVWGGGGSMSGVVMVPLKRLNDRFLFQVNGGVGIARYINDLQSLGGQDAMYDSTTNVLKALPVLGWWVDYEHVWKEWSAMEHMNLRSSFMWSIVGVRNFDFQTSDAYWKTNRLVVNAIFSPSTRVDMGIEYIFGNRYNKNGERGSANQIQLVGLFRF